MLVSTLIRKCRVLSKLSTLSRKKMSTKGERTPSGRGPEGVPWKEAATLMVIARDEGQGDSYSVLYMRRSTSNRFMAGDYVFPGGALSPADHSPRWTGLLSKATGRTVQDLAMDFKIEGQRPPMMSEARPGWALPPELVFRICAIRETFEECGILLIRPHTSFQSMNLHPITSGIRRTLGSAFNMNDGSDTDMQTWRKQVHQDPEMFVDMCEALNAIPDFWALMEWTNWLTPVFPRKKKHHRFDTLFYLAALDTLPNAEPDNAETTDLKWLSCKEAINKSISTSPENADFKLAVPQTLESGRMAHFPTFKKVASFAATREHHGIECIMPVFIACADGFLLVYPGDELYPEEPDVLGLWESPVYDASLEELRTQSSKHNRIERHMDSPETPRTVCTIQPKCGHLIPKINLTSSHL